MFWRWASRRPQCPPPRFHCPLSAALRGIVTFSPTLNEQETMHCEEEHKVEPTLPGEEKKQKTPIDAFVVNMHFVLQHSKDCYVGAFM